jgi:hypothetical protein
LRRRNLGHDRRLPVGFLFLLFDFGPLRQHLLRVFQRHVAEDVRMAAHHFLAE